MHILTEEEGELLHQIKEEYWLKFSKLVRDQALKAPKHLRAHCLVMLEESSSVHGSKYAGDVK